MENIEDIDSLSPNAIVPPKVLRKRLYQILTGICRKDGVDELINKTIYLLEQFSDDKTLLRKRLDVLIVELLANYEKLEKNDIKK